MLMFVLVLADSIFILADFANFFAGFAVGNYLLQIGRLQIANYGPNALTETKWNVM